MNRVVLRLAKTSRGWPHLIVWGCCGLGQEAHIGLKAPEPHLTRSTIWGSCKRPRNTMNQVNLSEKRKERALTCRGAPTTVVTGSFLGRTLRNSPPNSPAPETIGMANPVSL